MRAAWAWRDDVCSAVYRYYFCTNCTNTQCLLRALKGEGRFASWVILIGCAKTDGPITGKITGSFCIFLLANTAWPSYRLIARSISNKNVFVWILITKCSFWQMFSKLIWTILDNLDLTVTQLLRWIYITPIATRAFCHTPRICNFIDSLTSWVHLFTESHFSNIENLVPFENTNPINRNKKVKITECRIGWSD